MQMANLISSAGNPDSSARGLLIMWFPDLVVEVIHMQQV